MNLTPIVNQLRAYAPSFGKRVASAADYDPQAAASTSMKRPCAYVVFDGLELEESPNSQKVRQVIRESFSVFVEIDMGKGDERGAALVPEIHRLRKEIFRSLIGFRPDDECDPIQAKSVQIDSFNRSVAIVVEPVSIQKLSNSQPDSKNFPIDTGLYTLVSDSGEKR